MIKNGGCFQGVLYTYLVLLLLLLLRWWQWRIFICFSDCLMAYICDIPTTKPRGRHAQLQTMKPNLTTVLSSFFSGSPKLKLQFFTLNKIHLLWFHDIFTFHDQSANFRLVSHFRDLLLIVPLIVRLGSPQAITHYGHFDIKYQILLGGVSTNFKITVGWLPIGKCVRRELHLQMNKLLSDDLKHLT